jgi:hypothetical protein
VGRIRTIKPEIAQSEQIGRLSIGGRLLFLLLFTIVDDEGKAKAHTRVIASLCYPWDDNIAPDVANWLDELVTVGLIDQYEIEGEPYLRIRKWLKHQKIDHPSKSRIPDPPSDEKESAQPETNPVRLAGTRSDEQSREDSRGLARPLEAFRRDTGSKTDRERAVGEKKSDSSGRSREQLAATTWNEQSRESSRGLASPRESSRSLATDLGSRILDLGSRSERARARGEENSKPPEPKLEQLAPTADLEALEAWRAHREAVGKPLRPHELIAVGKTLTGIGDARTQRAVIQNCIANGWMNIRVADRPPTTAGGLQDSEGERAWADLITTEGGSRTPRVEVALNAVGGWQTIRARTPFNEQKIRSAFVRAFVEAVQ